MPIPLLTDSIFSQLKRDIEDTGKALNEDTVVSPRYGDNFLSFPAAIRQIVSNGLLGATPFATKALMQASSLANESYAVVTNDATISNNGFYRKEAGGWTYLKWNPISQAAEQLSSFNNHMLELFRFATSSIGQNYEEMSSSYFIESNDESLIMFVDKLHNVFARFGINAELFLTDLEGSVQQNIKDLKTASSGVVQQTSENDLIVFADAEQNNIAKFDPDGDLYILNVHGSVQGHLMKHSTNSHYSIRDFRFEHTVELHDALSLLHKKGRQVCPVPIHCFKQDYSIGAAWIDDIALIQPENWIVPKTPYKNVDFLVHPSICQFYDHLNGYQYYVALNPYGNGGEPVENPCLYGSQDLLKFDLLPWVAQPYDKPVEPMQYLSDVHLSYDPTTGDLLYVWRDTRNSGDGVWYARSKDGVNFTAKMPLYPISSRASHGGILSPSILYNLEDQLWYMYSVRTDGTIEYRTAEKITGLASDWSAPVFISDAGIAWHLDVRWIGDKLVGMINHRDNNTLCLMISSDWVTWTYSSVLNFLTGEAPYKASFVPEFNSSGDMCLNVVWTTSGRTDFATNNWRLYSAKTNFVNV